MSLFSIPAVATPVVQAARLEAAGLAPLDLHAGCTVDVDGIALSQLDLGFPAIRAVGYDRADADGVDDETSYHGARTVSVALTMFRGSLDAAVMLDRLRAFCGPTKRPTLFYKLAGIEERKATLRVAQQSAPVGLPRKSLIDVQAQWSCPEGKMFSAVGDLANVSPAGSTEPGRAYDLVFDRTYPSLAAGGQVVTVYGTVPTNPRIRIFGPCTNPRIENQTTGRKLEFTANGGIVIATGDYLEVDVSARTVRLNGLTDVGSNLYGRLDFAVSKWWNLQPGVNLIRFYPTVSASPSVAELTWSSAWL